MKIEGERMSSGCIDEWNVMEECLWYLVWISENVGDALHENDVP